MYLTEIYENIPFIINNIAGIFIVHFEIHSCTLGNIITKGTEGYDSVTDTCMCVH